MRQILAFISMFVFAPLGGCRVTRVPDNTSCPPRAQLCQWVSRPRPGRRMSTLSTPARCPAALHHKGLSPVALFSADRKSDRTTNDLAIAVPVQRAAAGFV